MSLGVFGVKKVAILGGGEEFAVVHKITTQKMTHLLQNTK